MPPHFVIDVEADGPYPIDYSMIEIGLVQVTPKLDSTFYGNFRPLEGAKFNPEALAAIGRTREETLTWDDPLPHIEAMRQWIEDLTGNTRPIFWSDNPGFDWAFFTAYLHRFTGDNPFGWSCRRIGDLYSGLTKNPYAKWKHLRKTKHTHNPVDDAKGNAEALLAIQDIMKVKIF